MKKRQLISLKSKKALSLMEFMIYLVILIIFLGLMAFLLFGWGKGGASIIKYFRDIF